MFIFVGWSKAIHANHLLYLYYTIFQQLSQEIVTFSHPNHAEGVYIIRNLLRYIINGLPLYIIKPQDDARWRVMRYTALP